MAKKEKPETKEKGEQLDLIDVAPENLKAIVKEVRIYKKHQSDRLSALKKEVEQKERIKALVHETKLQRLQDGTIKFEADNAIICVSPQDDLITIKEKIAKKTKEKAAAENKTESE